MTVKSKKQILDSIERLKAEREMINEKINELKQEMLQFCPVKIGDTVSVNGYSHQGKKMVLETLFYKEVSYKRNGYFCGSGHIIKVDGSIGVQAGQWSMEVEEDERS